MYNTGHKRFILYLQASLKSVHDMSQTVVSSDINGFSQISRTYVEYIMKYINI